MLFVGAALVRLRLGRLDQRHDIINFPKPVGDAGSHAWQVKGAEFQLDPLPRPLMVRKNPALSLFSVHYDRGQIAA
jgi:hypothetical protein